MAIRFRPGTLRARLLIAVLSTVTLIAGTAAVMFFVTATRQLDQVAASRLEAFDRSLADRLEQVARDLGLALELLVADRTVIEHFAARDRQGLLDRLLPLYTDRLREQYDLTQLHFHLAPATSFLRLHRPEQFGDDLSTWRSSLVLANRSRRPVSGLEVTRSGPGLKVIRPIFWRAEHIGSVEFATVLDRTLKHLGRSLGASYALGIDQETWSRARCGDLLTPIARRGGVVFYHASEPWLPRMLAGSSDVHAAPRVIRWEGRSIAARSLPIKEYTGRVVGEILAVVDMSAQARDLRKQLAVSLAMVGLASLGVALAMRGYLQKALARPLEECVRVAEVVSDGNLRDLGAGVSRRVGGWRSEEIDRLIDAFDRMVSYLRGMSEAATAMADGRFDDRVTPRTDSDLFGNALSRMQTKLRRTIDSIQASTSSVSSAVDSLATAADQIAVGAGEQSAATEETSASISETAAQSEQVAVLAAKLEQSVDDARAELTSVGRDITRLVDHSAAARSAADRAATRAQQMFELSAALESRIDVVIEAAARAGQDAQAGSEQMQALLTGVIASGREIGGLVSTIAALADQTHLLAINAAIQAERGGARGKGFAVVAQSIRSVAERTKDILGKVSATAGAVADQTADGVELSGRGSAPNDRIDPRDDRARRGAQGGYSQPGRERARSGDRPPGQPRDRRAPGRRDAQACRCDADSGR